ncbi:MAG: GlsB/YeaQ/YmgE family stress response membrane protein [Phenylobacterium sp.]
MPTVASLATGLLAGFLASKVINKSGSGLVADILIGIGGALAAGFALERLGYSGATAIDLYSLFVACLGSVVGLILYHVIIRRRPERNPRRF